MKRVEVDDILDAPGVCGPFAIKNTIGGGCTIHCPWCGDQVSEIKNKSELTYLDLTLEAAEAMVKHMIKDSCNHYKATSIIVLKRNVWPDAVWLGYGIKLEVTDGTEKNKTTNTTDEK